METEVNIKLLELVRSKLSSQLLSAELDLNTVVAVVKPDGLYDFLRLAKTDSELKFDMLLSVTAVDWLDQKDERFEIVYHLLSIKKLHRLRIKSPVSETSPEVQSVVDLWPGANFMEREVFDMFGINFKNHPDQRRILMYDEFVGYPLRKDYPVQAKQPRIPLRSPEVYNTARDMIRPPLVSIGSGRRKAAANEN